ncbi:MAG: ZIP family metal transporter [Verrucomicrobia bacterium]|nr:ZIP family metal transporter [Verrucomicrobiota bacterium]
MEYLILLSSIFLGALSVFGFKLDQPRHIKLLNAFTGAYLLSLTLLHLLPELYHHDADGHVHNLGLRLGLLILAGFFIQVALDYFSLGVEHGHSHHLHGRFPIGVLVGLCLHAFLEATALGDSHSHHDADSRRLLLWSIVLHNFPVSIALLGMLLHSGISRAKAIGWLAVFAVMAPLGMLVSAHTALAEHSRELMALVIGIFMHMATTILFESGDAHRINVHKMIAIVIGTALGILSVVIH